MSDILLQALLGASKRDAERDPFLAGARGIEQVDSSQYDMSPGQRILAGVLSGLGGGVARGIGESRVKDKFNTRSNNLMEGMRTGKLMEALAADEELSSIAPLYAMQEEQNKVGRLQELNKALLPKGMMMQSEGAAPVRLFDPNEDEINKALAIESGKMQLERGAGPSSKELMNLYSDTNKALRSSPQERTYSEVRRQTGTLADALKLDNPVAATAAIYSLAKVLDPSSVVREGEYKIVADPGSPVNAFNSVLKQIQGEGRLTDDTKANIRSILAPILKNTYGSYSDAANTYLDTVEKLGGDRNVVGLLPAYSLEDSPPAVAPQFNQADLWAEAQRRGLLGGR